MYRRKFFELFQGVREYFDKGSVSLLFFIHRENDVNVGIYARSAVAPPSLSRMGDGEGVSGYYNHNNYHYNY